MCRNIRPLNNFEPPATRDEVFEQVPSGVGDVEHGLVERGLVGLGRLGRPAHLAHELQGGRVHLVLGGRRLEVVEGSDVATHGAQRTSGGGAAHTAKNEMSSPVTSTTRPSDSGTRRTSSTSTPYSTSTISLVTRLSSMCSTET